MNIFLFLFLIPWISSQSLSFGAISQRILTGYDSLTRPLNGIEPVLVKSQLRINRLSSINPINSAFELDLFLRLQWTDARLKFPENLKTDALRLDPALLWTPDIYFYNEQRKMEVLDQTLKLQNDGTVFWSRHYIMAFTAPFKLQKFPFDTQVLPVKLVSYSHSQDEMRLAWYDESLGGPSFPPLAETFSSVLWELEAVDVVASNLTFRAGTTPYDLKTLNVTVNRLGSTYILKYIGPLFFIALCSTISYWLDSTVVPARVGFGVSLLLSTITLNFVVSSELPKINYPTLLDSYIAIVFGFVFSSLIEFSIVHYFQKIYRPHISMHIDRICRTSPIALILLTCVVFVVDKNSAEFYILWVLIGLYFLIILGYGFSKIPEAAEIDDARKPLIVETNNDDFGGCD